MASPDAGTYRIVSAKGSSSSPFCLDVQGGSNKNGANVRIWSPNFTGAQLFQLSYRKNGTAQLLSKWSGKSMDVANGSIAAGTNVQQWNDNDSRAQEWVVASDGNSATFEGETYPTYTIKLKANSSLALDISQGTMAAGTNVRVWTANGSEAQRWLLVPLPAFASGGTYELRSMLKTTMAVDVSGASGVKGGNVQLWNANGTNAQKWVVTEEESGRYSLLNVNSKMYADVKAGGTASGTNVQQWTDNDSRAQRWKMTQYGTTTINGTRCAVVTLGSYVDGSGTKLNMDVLNALTTNRANVNVETASNEASQRFALYPTTPRDDDMPVPADVGWSASVGDDDWTRVRAAADTLYPTWRTTGAWATDSFNHYEVRWRSQRMGAASSTWGAWSAWGAWRTAAVTVSGQRIWLTEGLPASVPSGSKAVQYEFQVRSAGTDVDGSAVRGHVTSATLRAIRRPAVTLSNPGFGPEGLRLDYESDYDGGTTTISVTRVTHTQGGKSVAKAVEGCTFSGLDQSGSILIPMSRLPRWMADGSTVRVRYEVGSDQLPISGATDTGALAVSYDTGSGLDVTPTVTAGAGRTIQVEIPTANVRKAWLRSGGRLKAMRVSNGKATVTYPFGSDMDYEVFVAAYSTDGDRWGVAHVSAAQMAAVLGTARPCHAWNWDGGSFLLELREGEPLSTEYGIDNDAQEYKLNAREWDSYRFGDTKSSRISAEGSFGEALDVEATRETLDALMDARHVTYRSPHGLVCDVAVLSCDLTCVRGIWECKVTMARETV